MENRGVEYRKKKCYQWAGGNPKRPRILAPSGNEWNDDKTHQKDDAQQWTRTQPARVFWGQGQAYNT